MSARYLILSIALLMLVTLPACRNAPKAPKGLMPSPVTQSFPTPSIGLVASETSAIPELPTPLVQTEVTRAFTPAIVTPSPIVTSSEETGIQTSTLIIPQNASRLVQIAQHEFSPWDQILAIRWLPDGRSLVVAAGDLVYILDIYTLEELARLEPGVATPGLDISPDGQLLAAGGRDGMLHIWDIDSGQEIQDFKAHQKSISSLEFSPDGKKLASAGYDAVARLWDAESLNNLGEIIGGTFAIPAIAFTPNGNSLAIVNGNVIRLRDVETTRFVISLIGEGSFYSIAIHPEGRFLASGDVNNSVIIWDLSALPGPGGEIRSSLLTLSGHAGRQNSPQALVWQVVFSPDGSLLASTGGDASLRLWNPDEGELLAVLTGHSKAVTSAAFSPDGRWLATGGLDGKVILWGVSDTQPASEP